MDDMQFVKWVCAITAAGLCVVGCSDIPADDLAVCKVPTSHAAGMGVRVDGCSEWIFGAAFTSWPAHEAARMVPDVGPVYGRAGHR